MSDQEGRRGGEPSKDVSSCGAVDRAQIAGCSRATRRATARMSAETGLPSAEPVRIAPPAFVVHGSAGQEKLSGNQAKMCWSGDLEREVWLVRGACRSLPPST